VFRAAFTPENPAFTPEKQLLHPKNPVFVAKVVRYTKKGYF